MNQITHWLDASNIYGSDEHEASVLRSNFGGQLKITQQPGSSHGVLPSCSKDAAQKRISMCNGCSKCFFAGKIDIKRNKQKNQLFGYFELIKTKCFT